MHDQQVSSQPFQAQMQHLSGVRSLITGFPTGFENRGRLPGNTLQGRIPEAATKRAVDWFIRYPVDLTVTSGRRSKAGDFRLPRNGRQAKITVNGNLNRFAFLITLVHEMAHFHVYQTDIHPFRKKRGRNTPHGTRWKELFGQCMDPYLTPEVFPPDILAALSRHLLNPGASTASDTSLSRILAAYDPESGLVPLEDLPEGAVFGIPGGKTFRKEGKIRKRYRCHCLTNGKNYLFSPVARVSSHHEKRL
jgi:hypothetical protein